jgi:Ca2+-transporting ATPase
VLARRSAVIETLGGASVLCVDKTGTLTENRMRLVRLWTERETHEIDGGAPVEGPAAELLQLARLASAVRPIDPMDRAVHALSSLPASAPPRKALPKPSSSFADCRNQRSNACRR